MTAVSMKHWHQVSVGAYDFIRGKLQTLDITPGQLGLEPCTGSMVVTGPG